MKYLSNDILEGFDTYKYSSKDTSPLSNYVMHPFWDWLVQFVPIWVAPNLMTFVGFLLTVINFLWLAYLDPNYTIANKSGVEISSFVWLIIGIFNFLSHQLDGIDGKQARRTGTSSPLGELFDHGCDSWVVSMLPLTVISIFGSDKYGVSHWEIYTAIWLMIICFIMSHWEKYLTGILYLPWGYDIGQNGGTLCFLITAICSVKVWKIVLPFPFNFSIATAGYLGVILSVTMSIPMTIYNIIQSYRLRTGQMHSLSEALRPLFSGSVLFISSLLWAVFSPNNILAKKTRLFLFVIGTVASNVTVKLIVSQMSKTRAELVNVLAIIYSLFALLIIMMQSVLINVEIIILWILSVVFAMSHVVMAIFIVRDLCAHLKIQAFSISYKLNANMQKNNK